MASNSRFMYDNVAPSFENLTHFMITQIPYHYTSICSFTDSSRFRIQSSFGIQRINKISERLLVMWE